MGFYKLSTQELLDLENARGVEFKNIQKDLIGLDQVIDGIEAQKIPLFNI